MARIAGVVIPDNKRVEISLTYIYGVGRSLSRQVLETTKIGLDKKVSDLSDAEIDKIRDEISKLEVEGDLRRMVTGNIRRLQEIGAYRGYRHRRGLPSRGQTTRRNARTRRGRKKVGVGSGRRKETKT